MVEHFDKLIATLDATRADLVKQRNEADDEATDIQNEENFEAYDDQKEYFNRGDMQ
jgi:hypothetical protein